MPRFRISIDRRDVEIFYTQFRLGEVHVGRILQIRPGIFEIINR